MEVNSNLLSALRSRLSCISVGAGRIRSLFLVRDRRVNPFVAFRPYHGSGAKQVCIYGISSSFSNVPAAAH